MKNNLMPKVAEILGVKLGEFVTLEFVSDPKISYNVSITEDGLKFDSEFYIERIQRRTLCRHYFDLDEPKVFNEEEFVLSSWLRGAFRVRGAFPKDGDKVFSVATKGIFNEHGYPRIEEFEFDSSSQSHLLLKDKGLLHETLEEAVKCFEKDYNMFKEMREGIKNQ